MNEPEEENQETQLPVVQGDGRLPDWVRGLPDFAKNNVVKLGKFVLGEGSYYVDAFAEKKRQNKAKEVLAVGAAEHVVKNFGTDDPLAQRALAREMNSLYREQENIEEVTRIASEMLKLQNPDSFKDEEVDDDWLHMFYGSARKFSSDQMRLLFGKILAGEVHEPGSFSPKTLQTITCLDKVAGETLQAFMSCAMALESQGASPRVIDVGPDIGNNGLREFGLSYNNLSHLREHGIMITDFNTYVTVKEGGLLATTIWIGDKSFRFEKIGKITRERTVNFSGIALTHVGQEISKVIDFHTNASYLEMYKDWIEKKYDFLLMEIAE